MAARNSTMQTKNIDNTNSAINALSSKLVASMAAVVGRAPTGTGWKLYPLSTKQWAPAFVERSGFLKAKMAKRKVYPTSIMKVMIPMQIR